MYDRNIAGKVLNFEASGSLYHSALVMQDDETDSYWAIMPAKAIGGELQGSNLPELPLSEKTTWGEWRKKHPHSLVLSVEGKTHIKSSPYDNYFTSDRVFGEVPDPDTRLGLKDSIFSFRHDGREFAVAHAAIINGWQGKAARLPIFVYRTADESFYRSTRAWVLKHQGKGLKLKQNGDRWVSKKYGAFDPETGRFENGGLQLESFYGMDTFWYIWSQYHREGELLARK